MLILDLLFCILFSVIVTGVVTGFLYLGVKYWYIGASFVTVATLLAMVIFIR